MPVPAPAPFWPPRLSARLALQRARALRQRAAALAASGLPVPPVLARAVAALPVAAARQLSLFQV